MISAPSHVHNAEFFRFMVDDLSLSYAAKLLDVTPRTIRTWIENDKVPKMAAMALFWESKFGRSVIDCDHRNELSLAYTKVSIMEKQLVRAKDIITGLRRMQYGSSNEPIYDALTDFPEASTAERHSPAMTAAR